jgi:hypothetical protein
VLAQTTDRPINQEAGAYLFPGYLPIVLAAAAFMWSARSGVPRPWYGSSWTRAALAIEVIWIASLLMTLYVVAVGPIRWRLGTATLLSVRDVSRAALLVTTATVLRAAMIRRVPINVAARLRRWRDGTGPWRDFWRRDSRGFYLLLLLATLWLSAGPPIGLWPAVYWLPGLNFIRVASRFTLLGVLCLAILAAFGFDRWTARLPDRRRTLAGAAAAAFLVIEFAAIPLETFAYRVAPPAADVWLASRPGPFSVVEVPVPTAHEGGEERRQTIYMLHSMAHWQKTVHGYSGLRPPLHFDLFRQLRFFPDATSLAQLKQLGVDYAVVHVDLYPSGEWPPVEARLAEFGDVLTLEYADASSRVYSIN